MMEMIMSVIPEKDMTPFEKASLQILKIYSVSELEQLEELLLIRKAEIQPYVYSFDLKRFEGKLRKRLKDVLALLECDITGCSTFYSDESPTPRAEE
jgi:hypothetical protein